MALPPQRQILFRRLLLQRPPRRSGFLNAEYFAGKIIFMVVMEYGLVYFS